MTEEKDPQEELDEIVEDLREMKHEESGGRDDPAITENDLSN